MSTYSQPSKAVLRRSVELGLAPPVRVQDAACDLVPAGDRVVEGGDHDASLHPVVDGPADDPVREHVLDGAQVELPLAGRVHLFPGKLACDRYSAARRSTSFPCSSSRTRLRSSRFSACSSLDGPGRLPASRSAWVIQFVRHDSEILKSAACP
jgi:hypothetical protein